MSSVLVCVASYWCCRWCLFSSLFSALFLSCCKLMFAGMAMATEVYPSRICCYLKTDTQIWSAAMLSNVGLLGFNVGTKSELHADTRRKTIRERRRFAGTEKSSWNILFHPLILRKTIRMNHPYSLSQDLPCFGCFLDDGESLISFQK